MILQDLEFCFYVAFHLMSQLKKNGCKSKHIDINANCQKQGLKSLSFENSTT